MYSYPAGTPRGNGAVRTLCSHGYQLRFVQQNCKIYFKNIRLFWFSSTSNLCLGKTTKLLTHLQATLVESTQSTIFCVDVVRHTPHLVLYKQYGMQQCASCEIRLSDEFLFFSRGCIAILLLPAVNMTCFGFNTKWI